MRLRRFVRFRVEGSSDECRSGRPRTVLDEQVAEVVNMTVNAKPPNAAHRSLRSMAAKVGLSHTMIRRIWQAHSMRRHRSERFKPSTDPPFVDKVRDVVGLYMSPPDNAVVLCVDEKSRMQALSRDRPVPPMVPGMPERYTHAHRRHGTTSLFAAPNVATGAVIDKCHERRRSEEFLNFLERVEAETPEDMDVHIVTDDLSTHKTRQVRDRFAGRRHWHVRFTPTGASWINLAERLFSDLVCKRLKRGARNSVKEQEADVEDFIETHNDDPKPQRMGQIGRRHPQVRQKVLSESATIRTGDTNARTTIPERRGADVFRITRIARVPRTPHGFRLLSDRGSEPQSPHIEKPRRFARLRRR